MTFKTHLCSVRLVATFALLASACVAEGSPGTGWLVLRDMSGGVMLGGLTGAAVGALFWASSGRPKNVLTGLSLGALIGGAAGIVYGLVEAGAAPSHAKSRAQPRLGLTFALLPDERGALAVVPALAGRF